MLYLPPQYAHDGIAEGDCMTYSIGFRAPTYRELGVALLIHPFRVPVLYFPLISSTSALLPIPSHEYIRTCHHVAHN